MGGFGRVREFLSRNPHLDKLAADGTRFTRWHACPNCAPTRAAMLTGQY
ncbi:MAG: sulfatase-like hydrolase/transferase, partial [Armatimonadaceae bacterium]